jgi:mRNA degradation ribonuclease J1/J2
MLVLCFLRADMLGVDKVIPDFSYLLENKHQT